MTNSSSAESSLKAVVTLRNVPSNVSYLSDKPGEEFANADVKIFWNPHTQHAHIDSDIESSYYEDYVMTTSYSNAMQRLQTAQLDRLIIHCSESLGRCNSVLEVGCGDGSFLRHAARRVDRILGIEPSASFCELARKHNIPVLNCFLEESTEIDGDKFDCFVSRQVFEHLEDPLSVLNATKNFIHNGSVGLIEVPNGYRALRKGLFYEIFPDHINYYSVNSLVELASSAGFNVISCNESFNGHYLELWLRYAPDFASLISKIPEIKEATIQDITKFLVSSEGYTLPLAIWGAGAKTISIMSALEANSIASIRCVIDSDPNKSYKHIPNTTVPVLPCHEALKLGPFRGVLILALSYVNEIASDVHHHFGNAMPVFQLTESGRVIRLPPSDS
jgi:SAM-dependent methyltransferase